MDLLGNLNMYAMSWIDQEIEILSKNKFNTESMRFILPDDDGFRRVCENEFPNDCKAVRYDLAFSPFST